MATASPSNRNWRHAVVVRRPGRDLETRFDRRLARILSMPRMCSATRACGRIDARSLPPPAAFALRLVLYFESKEELLYLIQKHTFSTIVIGCVGGWIDVRIRRPDSPVYSESS